MCWREFVREMQMMPKLARWEKIRSQPCWHYGTPYYGGSAFNFPRWHEAARAWQRRIYADYPDGKSACVI